MGTKLKKFSYSSFLKGIMFILLVLVVFIFTNNINDLMQYDNARNNSSYLLNAYNKETGVDYYTDMNDTKSILSYNLETMSLDEFIRIVYDNGQEPVHKIIDLNLDNYLNSGIRYILVNRDTDRVIGTDGITNMNVNPSSWNDDITCSRRNIWNSYDISYLTTDEIATLQRDGIFDDRYGDEVYVSLDLYVKYDDSINSTIQTFFDENFDFPNNIALTVTSGFMIGLILLYFLMVSGQSSKEMEVKYMFLDKIYFDILLVIYGLLMFFAYVYLLIILDNYNYNIVPDNLFILLFSIVASIITVFTVNNLGKRLKKNDLLNSCLFIVIIKSIYGKIVDVITFKSEMRLKIFFLLSIFTFFIVIYEPGFGIVLIPIYIYYIWSSLKLSNTISMVNKNRKYKFEKRNRDFMINKPLEDLGEISEKMDNMYQEGLKAQNLKTELITNVSHDLRTPLTSIIGYVDLLENKSENFDEETREYINVLRDKSNRMNDMVQDLFDLSKSVSGNLDLDLSKVNVKKLIEQTLSELDDVITNKNIVLNLQDDLYINADGAKMYRVMQNIIGNGCKYSMDNTRIYIEASTMEDDRINIEVKNIANYKMDFNAQDIKERFVRGDKSRTGEGSGLGLSIAQTYTNLNGGLFNVIVDGDMFKIQIIFKKINN